MPKARGCPDNWPASIPYLSYPILAPDLPRTILSTQALTSPTLEPNAATIPNPQTPYANIRITAIEEAAHPAYQQFGLFATRVHLPDTFICLYLGMVYSTASESIVSTDTADSTSHPKSDYDLSLDRDLGLAVDAATMGNEARFINDYRGIADRPNAEFRDVIVKAKDGKKERGVGVFVKAMKKAKKRKSKKEDGIGIRKGEEIVVSYGRGFWSARRTEAEAGQRLDTGLEVKAHPDANASVDSNHSLEES